MAALSKHLASLSFKIVHNIMAGIFLHHFCCSVVLSLLRQFFLKVVVSSGIVHLIPSTSRNNFHNCEIVGKSKNKWLM